VDSLQKENDKLREEILVLKERIKASVTNSNGIIGNSNKFSQQQQPAIMTSSRLLVQQHQQQQQQSSSYENSTLSKKLNFTT